jgi:hypothetical protein
MMRSKILVKITLATCALSLGLTGCVVMPFPVVPEEDLFAEKRVQFIQPGGTTRAQILKEFGAPRLSRMDGNLVVYGQARTVADVFAGTIIGTGGVNPIETNSTLIVQYDEGNTVIRADVLRGAKECTEYGLCIEARFDWQETGKMMEHDSVLTSAVVPSSGADDQLAKQFATAAEGCRVYLYSAGADTIVTASSSATGTNPLSQRGYLVWAGEPGSVSIRASQMDEWPEKMIHCSTQALLFVSVYAKSCYGNKPPEISLDTETAGKDQITARSLILY